MAKSDSDVRVCIYRVALSYFSQWTGRALRLYVFCICCFKMLLNKMNPLRSTPQLLQCDHPDRPHCHAFVRARDGIIVHALCLQVLESQQHKWECFPHCDRDACMERFSSLIVRTGESLVLIVTRSTPVFEFAVSFLARSQPACSHSLRDRLSCFCLTPCLSFKCNWVLNSRVGSQFPTARSLSGCSQSPRDRLLCICFTDLCRLKCLSNAYAALFSDAE